MKEVYEGLRSSKYWNETLFIITYDEHGGFPDSKKPPMNVTNPTPDIETTDGFNFHRLGMRVPAVAISPWINKGVDSTIYEHATVPKITREIFNLKSDYLTSREAEANSFLNEKVLASEIRTDCPEVLPDVPFKKDYLYNYKEENHNAKPYLDGTAM